jgi:hypothetical protein
MLISLLPFPPTPVVPMPAPPNPERDTCYRFGLAMSSIASFPWLTLAMAGSALPPLAFFDRLRHSTRLGYLGSRSAGPFLASSNQSYTTDSSATRSSGVIFRHQPFHCATCTSLQTLCECQLRFNRDTYSQGLLYPIAQHLSAYSKNVASSWSTILPSMRL